MIRWWEHSEKGGRDGRRDGQTDNTICRAAWSQLKTYRLKTFADLRRRWRSCVTRIGHTAAADAPVGSCIQLSHLYASVPPVYFCCSWISWSSRNFRQRSWLHCDSYWSFLIASFISLLVIGSWSGPGFLYNSCVSFIAVIIFLVDSSYSGVPGLAWYRFSKYLAICSFVSSGSVNSFPSSVIVLYSNSLLLLACLLACHMQFGSGCCLQPQPGVGAL